MFKKLLLIVISILFTCSALEIEIGEAKQTFSDEYDTYVPSKPVIVKESQIPQIKKVELKKSETQNYFLYLTASDKKGVKSLRALSANSVLSPHLPHPILLLKSELRI